MIIIAKIKKKLIIKYKKYGLWILLLLRATLYLKRKMKS